MAIRETLLDCIHANREPPPVLVRAVARLRADGYKPCEPACYIREDGSVYASSFEIIPGTYGHPAHAVEIDARGRMWIRNRPADDSPAKPVRSPRVNMLP